MKQSVDIRAGYRVPDGYFEDFAMRMSAKVAMEQQTLKFSSEPEKKPRNRYFIRTAISLVSSVAAVIVLSIGIFQYTSSVNNPMGQIQNLDSDEIITAFFGATENDVINYYYLPEDDYTTSSYENANYSYDDVLNYVSNSGNVNLYALMGY